MYRKVDKDYEALIEKLYDPDDPYGSTMWVIGEALTKGLNDDSYMNEHEYSLLVGIARAFVVADPYARCPSCGMMGSSSRTSSSAISRPSSNAFCSAAGVMEFACAMPVTCQRKEAMIIAAAN